MFVRVVISTLLIAIGIASPWLVKDWMDWKADAERADRFYDRVSGVSDRIKRNMRDDDEREGFSIASVESESLESDPEPYPLASKTMRILKGMMPSAMGVQASADSSVFGLESNDIITKVDLEEVKNGLQEQLGKLGLALGNPIFVRIFKEEHELEVWVRKPATSEFTLFKVYRIMDWSGSPGPKIKEGDGQAPEGFYFVSKSRLRPETRHHLGIDLGFPNEYDSSKGRSGSGILIHGGEKSAGSFVLEPSDIEEVYALAVGALDSGQVFFRVNAFPFRMTDQRMEKEWKKQPRWIEFWVQLKEGYDFFENVNSPPDVSVRSGEYHFQIH
ncbi:MAG: hypothetical protein AAF357_04740 [Verrucomicrobiota bacterium]